MRTHVSRTLWRACLPAGLLATWLATVAQEGPRPAGGERPPEPPHREAPRPADGPHDRDGREGPPRRRQPDPDRGIRDRGPGRPGGEVRLRELEERRNHLAQAIDHLHAAGMHELAEQATRHLEELNRMGHRSGPGTADLRPAVADLNRAVEQLRDELRQLRKEMEMRHRGPDGH